MSRISGAPRRAARAGRRAGLIDDGETAPHQQAVLLGQWGHVGHGSWRDEVEEIVTGQLTPASAEGRTLIHHEQRLRQLVGQADASQVLGGIRATRLTRADDGGGGSGQRLGWLVVVGDDDVEAEAAALDDFGSQNEYRSRRSPRP
ncbi:MAG: hypothetical protein KIS91_07155 [Anaerolineae bacterium]|nr:hypothetical protein [Anaerolineae bacterium]